MEERGRRRGQGQRVAFKARVATSGLQREVTGRGHSERHRDPEGEEERIGSSDDLAQGASRRRGSADLGETAPDTSGIGRLWRQIWRFSWSSQPRHHSNTSANVRCPLERKKKQNVVPASLPSWVKVSIPESHCCVHVDRSVWIRASSSSTRTLASWYLACGIPWPADGFDVSQIGGVRPGGHGLGGGGKDRSRRTPFLLLALENEIDPGNFFLVPPGLPPKKSAF